MLRIYINLEAYISVSVIFGFISIVDDDINDKFFEKLYSPILAFLIIIISFFTPENSLIFSFHKFNSIYRVV